MQVRLFDGDVFVVTEYSYLSLNVIEICMCSSFEMYPLLYFWHSIQRLHTMGNSEEQLKNDLEKSSKELQASQLLVSQV